MSTTEEITQLKRSRDEYNALYADVLSIPGFSINQLRKVKHVMLSLKLTSYTVAANSIECVKKIGELDYKINIPFSDIPKVKAITKHHFELLGKLENNHSLRYSVFDKFFVLSLRNMNGKWYLSPKYTFNIGAGEIQMSSAPEIADWIMSNVKANKYVVTEDILFIPKGLLVKDILEACGRYYSEFRQERYVTSACLFAEWNYKYKIFNELPLYSLDESSCEREMFISKCTLHQVAYLEYLGYGLPYTIYHESPSPIWPIVNDLKDGTINMVVFKGKHKITEDFEQQVDKLFHRVKHG